jgi:FkbM family methyltransferase
VSFDGWFDMTEAPDVATLREAFRNADKATRQRLAPTLPPADIEFLGIRMHVDPRDNYTERCLWLDGLPPEVESLTAVMELVEGRDAFILDIGANCGAYAVPLGVAVGRGSRVVAVEPNPVMVGRLDYNVRMNNLNDVVRVDACALGEASGEAPLYQSNWNFGQASLRKPDRQGHKPAQLVPVRSVLDYAEEASRHAMSVIKIDVEGTEDTVLNPLFAAGHWLPDVLLIETIHARLWEKDLKAKITASGYDAMLETEGNTLFIKG